MILLHATASGASICLCHWSQRAWKQLRTAGRGFMCMESCKLQQEQGLAPSFPLLSLLQNSRQSFSSPSPTCFSSAAQLSAGLQLHKCSKQPIGILASETLLPPKILSTETAPMEASSAFVFRVPLEGGMLLSTPIRSWLCTQICWLCFLQCLPPLVWGAERLLPSPATHHCCIIVLSALGVRKDPL